MTLGACSMGVLKRRAPLGSTVGETVTATWAAWVWKGFRVVQVSYPVGL